jgi:dimethylaniline monooxygenase (N-oxide forming)
MAFSDFPMPNAYPPYPYHSQIFAYFQAYATHFDLYPHITFHTQVTQVAPAKTGGYDVTIRHIHTG